MEPQVEHQAHWREENKSKEKWAIQVDRQSFWRSKELPLEPSNFDPGDPSPT